MDTITAAEHVDLAEKSGFTAAASITGRELKRATRLARAYEHYRYVRAEVIVAFNYKLRASTSSLTAEQRAKIAMHSGYHTETYDKLVLTPADSYEKLPPADVLNEAAKANATGIFDKLEVAWIETKREVHDPLLFGVIEGCTDRFFIAQWGDDVKITDLLADNEG